MRLKVVLFDNLTVSCGCRGYHKNLSIHHSVRGKKLFIQELVRAFGCDLLLSMPMQKHGNDL
jgi:hypothetical protein